MPIYEYRCQKCSCEFELLQKHSDEPPSACRECGGPVSKLISLSGFQLKGSGWYVTDYARKSGDSGKDKGGGSGKDKSGESSDKSGESSKDKGSDSGEEKKAKPPAKDGSSSSPAAASSSGTSSSGTPTSSSSS